MRKFPKDFIFGAATSAYQIEGAFDEDGRGKTYWDTHNKDELGNPVGETGDRACDHYHRYQEDVALMKKLGLQSYRFSISWVRIFPKYDHVINPLGVLFYQNLIHELIKNGIEPVVTIWHGDLPLYLDELGGWKSEETITEYLFYAKTLFDLFGDQVKVWFTHNEPWCAAFLGGHSLSDSLTISHHLLLAHAKAVKLYHEHEKGNGKIGIVLNLGKVYPFSDTEKDHLAARNVDGFINRFFLDPCIFGRYPSDMIALYENLGGSFTHTEEEMSILKDNRMDFLGINVYARSLVEYDENNTFLYSKDVHVSEHPYTEMGWEVFAEGLHGLLVDLKNNYENIDVYITENGAAFKDENYSEERVYDQDRTDYYKGHLNACLDAIEEGCHLRRYYAWSLFDNFEWGLGYSKRFGIIRVDYETLKRTIKDSGYFYQNVIKNRGL